MILLRNPIKPNPPANGMLAIIRTSFDKKEGRSSPRTELVKEAFEANGFKKDGTSVWVLWGCNETQMAKTMKAMWDVLAKDEYADLIDHISITYEKMNLHFIRGYLSSLEATRGKK